jgi:hypothetical protein
VIGDVAPDTGHERLDEDLAGQLNRIRRWLRDTATTEDEEQEHEKTTHWSPPNVLALSRTEQATR